MTEYALLLAAIGATLVYHAWRERICGNRRDAHLLGVCALAVLVGSGATLYA